MARRATPTDPATQLVQLGQAQALGVLDNHQAGVGYIDPDFDHRGGYQQLQVALLEFGHDRSFLGGLHASVNQADTQLAQGATELLKSGFGSLAGQLFGLFDQGTDPIGLTSFGARGAHPFDHFEAPAVSDQHSVDRRTPRWQFIEDRGVQVGVGTHRQGPWDRRCGHDQLVRAKLAAYAFLAQRQALLDAEAVLFVDDRQGQVLELHLVLEQCMGADHHGGTTCDLLQGAGAGFALELAGQPGDLDAQRLQPALEGHEVLFGENLCGGHQRHLIACLERLQGRQGRDHGLAGANVTLDQAQHRLWLAQVVGNLVADPLLCARRCKAEVGQVLLRQARSLGQHRSPLRAQALAQALLGQLVGQQLFKRQAVLGPVLTLGKFVHISIGGWVVQVTDGIVERRELVIPGQFQRQPVG
ncbi:hypothetical protein D3C77_370440 [compost metagenome]